MKRPVRAPFLALILLAPLAAASASWSQEERYRGIQWSATFEAPSGAGLVQLEAIDDLVAGRSHVFFVEIVRTNAPPLFVFVCEKRPIGIPGGTTQLQVSPAHGLIGPFGRDACTVDLPMTSGTARATFR